MSVLMLLLAALVYGLLCYLSGRGLRLCFHGLKSPEIALKKYLIAAFGFGFLLALLSVIVPNFRQTGGRGVKRVCLSQLKSFQAALEMYKIDTQATGEQLASLSVETLVKNKYLQSPPSDPGIDGTFTKGSNYRADEHMNVWCINHGSFPGEWNGPNPVPEFIKELNQKDYGRLESSHNRTMRQLMSLLFYLFMFQCLLAVLGIADIAIALFYRFLKSCLKTA